MIGITLTGADERADLSGLVQLADWGAEIGILYSFSPDGRHRYPDPNWLQRTVECLGGRAALHICGLRARNELLLGRLDCLTKYVRRIQVNGSVYEEELRGICDRYPNHTLITQHTEANAPLVAVDAPNHALLVDGSGGRGVLPSEWVRPDTHKPVGFAGGLTPDNLRVELPRIAAVARGESWIDLESGLRDADDWFSFDRAARSLGFFQGWQSSEVSHG